MVASLFTWTNRRHISAQQPTWHLHEKHLCSPKNALVVNNRLIRNIFRMNACIKKIRILREVRRKLHICVIFADLNLITMTVSVSVTSTVTTKAIMTWKKGHGVGRDARLLRPKWDTKLTLLKEITEWTFIYCWSYEKSKKGWKRR